MRNRDIKENSLFILAYISIYILRNVLAHAFIKINRYYYLYFTYIYLIYCLMSNTDPI